MKPWMSVQNFVLVFAGIFVVALLKLTSSELASWVQAVGSIAAIWGAFSISNRQVTRQEKIRAQESKRSAQAQLAVVKNAADYGKSMGEFASKTPPPFALILAWRMTLDVTTSAALDSLRVLPVHELGSYEQVLHFNGILAALVKLRADVNTYVNGGDESEAVTFAAYQAFDIQSKMIEHHWVQFKIAFDKYSSS